MERIIVGTDGSASATNAVRWAARLAGLFNAELIVMTGFAPRDSELRPERAEALLAEQQRKLDSWSKAARIGDLSVRTVVKRGDPRDGITSLADQEDADLIVVGRAGSSGGPGFLHLGSMAEWLAHHSSRPIAIIGGAVNLRTRSILVGLDGSEGSQAALKWVRQLAAVSEVRIVAASVDQPYLEWTPADSPDNWRRGSEWP